MIIPERNISIESQIDKWCENLPEEKRLHFGMSQAGHKCDRYLWLSFRWAVNNKFPGRVLRIFDRGNDEENKVVRLLRNIGIDVRETGNQQRRVYFGGHCSGSVDGMIKSGVPGAEKTEHILEIKTHNDRSFNDLLKNGVEKSKTMHYIQMQVYMRGTKTINRALYVAVNKNDDRIYTERVKLNIPLADKYIDRARNISELPDMPEPLSTDPTWYECKFCSMYSFCHGEVAENIRQRKNAIKRNQEINCRTCVHSTAKNDGSWLCESYNSEMDPNGMRDSWPCHVPMPKLMPEWRLIETECTEKSACYKIEKDHVLIGDDGYSTVEVLRMIDKKIPFGDNQIETVKKIFDGEVGDEDTFKTVPLF